LSFANHEVLSTLGAWFRPTLGRDPGYNKKNVDLAEHLVKRIMKYLDGYLQDHTYLVGERLTIADLVLTAHLDRGFQYVNSLLWVADEFSCLTANTGLDILMS
jgi:elongation factor 1-gamma